MTGFNDLAKAVIAADGGKDGGYKSTIPDNWRQGRTAYGGLTAGLSLVAAQKQFPDLRPYGETW